MTMKNAGDYLLDAARRYDEASREYGNNYKQIGEILHATFPNGLTLSSPDDWNRLHLFLLTLVKLARYSQNWDAGGHPDSLTDTSVYSAMLNEIDAEINGRPGPAEIRNLDPAAMLDVALKASTGPNSLDGARPVQTVGYQTPVQAQK